MSKHRKHIRRDEAHIKTVHIDLGDQIIPHFNANPKYGTVEFYGTESKRFDGEKWCNIKTDTPTPSDVIPVKFDGEQWGLVPELNPRDLEVNWHILNNFHSEFAKVVLGNVDKKDRHPITLEKLDYE